MKDAGAGRVVGGSTQTQEAGRVIIGSISILACVLLLPPAPAVCSYRL